MPQQKLGKECWQWMENKSELLMSYDMLVLGVTLAVLDVSIFIKKTHVLASELVKL